MDAFRWGFLLLVAAAATLLGHEPISGTRGFVEYRPGDLALILTAPHGGALDPDDLPDRTEGVLGNDLNTVELAEAMADAIAALHDGKRPHVVISHLRRRKLDPNREVGEAAQGSPEAILAWEEFHAFIEQASSAVADRHGRGLLLDIHGHGHPIAQVEIGYALPAQVLNRGDRELADPEVAGRATIRALAAQAGVPFPELLRGPKSLGALLEARGYPAIPSPRAPGPAAAPYFNGGYIVRRHGALAGGPVDAIQLEHPGPGIRRRAEEREAYAEAAAEALVEYWRHWTGRSFADESAVPAAVVDEAFAP